MSFSMNFTIDADLKRKLIREKIYGIWKDETAQLYHAEFIKVAEPLIRGKWAKLIDLNNWRSSYPETIDIIGDHLRWCMDNGMILSVNIIENPVTSNQLKKMFVQGGTEEISRMFRTIAEGDKFLRENGF
ncbi:hypothetical protein TRIP_C60411 [Candidatus Zixiibacteriota bacterium]|nr:hypothetical protein TRIP_C60411 [candidate division Zixibacteria bacterium]